MEDLIGRGTLCVIGKRIKLTGLKEISEVSDMYGSTQIEGKTKNRCFEICSQNPGKIPMKKLALKPANLLQIRKTVFPFEVQRVLG